MDDETGPAPPPPGVPVTLAPGLSRIIAPNPSPMTHWGTNTYLIGHKTLMIVDPGPASSAHQAALATAIAGRPVSHIVVTHAHLDHSAGAPALAQMTGAPVVAFGAATAGRSAVMAALAASGLIGGGEGIDSDFVPDITVRDGDRIDNGEEQLRVLHTPGHLGGHLCLGRGAHWFTGDHLMGWAPSLVSPPDGDLTDFMASCGRLRRLAVPGGQGFAGHGASIGDVGARVAEVMAHRQTREAQILAALATAPGTAQALAARIYVDVAPSLLPAASRNVLAHLIDLMGRNHVMADGPITARTQFARP